MYKDGICSCGHPTIIAHDDEHEGWLVPKTAVCHACAALDKERDGEEKTKPGQKVYIVDERGSAPPPA